MAGLIITLSEFVQCFSGLRAFSLNHSSFDFPSSLFGRQGRWYDPVSQMRKSRPMGSNKMYPAKWLRWMGPRPWSHHLELSPAQPAPLAAVPRPVLQGAMLSRRTRGTQTSPSRPSRLFSTAVSIISLLSTFLSGAGRKLVIAPHVVPAHLF